MRFSCVSRVHSVPGTHSVLGVANVPSVPRVLWLVVAVLVSPAASSQDKHQASSGVITITPVIHSSVQLEHGGKVIQVDPWSLGDYSQARPADLILVTDDVGHHLDVTAIEKVRKPMAPVVIAANGRSRVPDGIVLANGESTTVAGFRVEAIAAYDIKPGEPYHPKGEANGYVITIGGSRVDFAGVTECIPEIRALKNIDVAFFPMNVPLERMEPVAAAECIRAFKPKVVYPYHYDQDWVTRVGRREPRPTPMTRGLDELRTALSKDGIEVRLAHWYPVTAPIGTHTELGLQGSAKVLCSAVFVSGRDADEFAKNSGFWFMPADEAEKVTWTVDRDPQDRDDNVRRDLEERSILWRSGLHHRPTRQGWSRVHASISQDGAARCDVARLADGRQIASRQRRRRRE